MHIKDTTKTGKPFIIRKAIKSDAKNLVEFASLTFKTSDATTLTSNGEFNLTTEQEEEFIQKMNEDTDNCICMIAEQSGQIISLLGFHGHQKRKAKHTGEFGISVHPDLQDQGIGRKMIIALIDWARSHPIIERVELSVSTNNPRGIYLYESLGFEREGYKKKAMKLDTGEYTDVILMCLLV